MDGNGNKTLDKIFYPDSVAIVGASNNKGKFGYMYTESFVNIGHRNIFPINPKEKEVMGFKAYPSVKDVPEDVDLALLVIPPEFAPEVVKECVEKGVKGVILYTSGFRELGEEGRKKEEELVAIAKGTGTRLIGPNCMGIYNAAGKVSFSPTMPKETGPIGMISHSGSMCNMLTNLAGARGMKFSKVVSCGNECDLNWADFLEYMAQDPETGVVIGYLEGTRNGRRFLDVARETTLRKPVIVWKAGFTERGARAASSHTGAMAGSARVWDAVFKQSGLIQVKSAEELIDLLMAFYYLPSLPKGRRVVIVSGPGGPAVTASDSCTEMGLTLAELSQETRAKLGQVIPAVGTSTDNPVDLGMGIRFNPHYYGEALKILEADGEVDIILVIGGGNPRINSILAEARKEMTKPVLAAVTMMADVPREDIQFMIEAGIPPLPDARRAAAVFAKLCNYVDYLRKRGAYDQIENWRGCGLGGGTSI